MNFEFVCSLCGDRLRKWGHFPNGSKRFHCPPCGKMFSEGQVNGIPIKEQLSRGQHKRKYRPTTTGYRGVFYDKKRGNYIAKIVKNRKQYFLGRFKSAQEAAIAYNLKALELYGHSAHQNSINPQKSN